MSRWDEVVVGDSNMPIYVGEPAGSGPHPIIILTFHRGGMDRFTIESTDRLASEGFFTLAPDFYHRYKDLEAEEAVKFRLDVEVIADIKAAVGHASSLDSANVSQMAIMGHCMGGRTAYLGACALPDTFKLCIPFYSGGVFSSWGDGPSVFDRFNCLKCRVHGFYGNEDKNPSPDDVNRFDKRLTELGVEHTFYRYDGAGHAFQNTVNAANFRPDQSEDAWGKVLKILNAQLMG
ncbi:MAG: dienelactone hydrolase family protein [Pseudomonadota bacterium]|nr:dienelactone hydrolase family protein [Pseudomonadota bacterium]